MSVTSSTTALRDQEVPSPNSFRNRLLLITITRGDGTPMDASSILEEDIMEICIQRAHIHLLGVLWYSEVESVILFRSLEDVNRVHRTLPDVMELCNEAITVQTMAPTEAHVAAFTAIWCSNTTAGDGEPHTPPYQTPPSEETLCTVSMLSLEILMIVSFNSLLRISHARDCTVQINCAPQQPPPHDWVHPIRQ